MRSRLTDARRSRWAAMVFGLVVGVPFILPERIRGLDVPQAEEDQREAAVMRRFLQALEKSPRRGTALDRVYGYHVEHGTLDGFVKELEGRVAENPKDGAGWMLLGLFEAQRGRDAAAVAAFKQAEKYSEDPLAAFYLGQALVLVGEPDPAAAAFESAIAKNPPRHDLLEIFQALGRVYQRTYRAKEALAVWKRLEEMFPDDERVGEQIAATLAEEGQSAAAAERYKALADRTKDKYRQTVYRMEGAKLELAAGRQQEALASLERLLGELNPENWLYREVRRGIEDAFLKSDDLAGLAKYYEGWVDKHPDDVEAMTRLGRTLATQGRGPEARKWYAMAVERAPSNRALREALIAELIEDRQFAEAAKEYEALAKLDPNNPDIARAWGQALLKDPGLPEPERKAKAAELWRGLLAAKKDDPALTTQVADWFRQAGMNDEAIALYQRAIELSPDAPQYREYLGEFYHALKRSDEAKATWRALAEGANKNAKNLARLAEVYATFGYVTDAVGAAEEAVALEADDFGLRLRLGELLLANQRSEDALAQVAQAEKLAETDQEREDALALEIKALQARDTLKERADALANALAQTAEPNLADQIRLARYQEAASDFPAALTTIRAALARDETSTAAWRTAARVFENGGEIGAAADAYRKLARLDRRTRGEDLIKVAELETRLGRRDQALAAGKEVLASSPGNPESFKFYADLCFQLNRPEEGFDALRRAVRINPADSKMLLELADSYRRYFRPGEALELYWRAFEKAEEIKDQLSIVASLAEIYLETNQFERLIERLQRLRAEDAGNERPVALAIAQAHHSAGDYGTARSSLEALLAASPRDVQLLEQLASLAETEGDLESAIQYQRQLVEVAPGDEANMKLAQFLFRDGQMSEAQSLWSRLATADNRASRILSAIDQLLGGEKSDDARELLGRILRERPDDWDALYRDGVALAQLRKFDEARARFTAILNLPAQDNDPSAAAQARKSGNGTRARQNPNNPFPQKLSPTIARLSAVYQARQVVGLDVSGNYYPSSSRSIWSPDDFGQARLAALAWLYRLASDAGTETADKFVQDAEAKAASNQERALWDLYYLRLVLQKGPDTLKVARRLADLPSIDAKWVYLYAVQGRTQGNPRIAIRARADAEPKDATPPLAPEELDYLLATYRAVNRETAEWIGEVTLSIVLTELKRAGREAAAAELYRESIARASKPEALRNLMSIAAARGAVDDVLALVERLARLEAGKSTQAGVAQAAAQAVTQAMRERDKSKDYPAILALVDGYYARLRPLKALGPKGRAPRRGGSSATYNLQIGGVYRSTQVDYPQPNEFFDQPDILVLRAAYEMYLKADLTSDLIAHFRALCGSAPEAERIFPRLALSYLHWWNRERDEAATELGAAIEMAPNAAELKLDLAEMHELANDPAPALAIVDTVEATDQFTVQRREQLALRLAILAGNVERAKTAAERLFGLRLDLDSQLRLAGQMHQIGMHPMAEAVLARARTRSGGRGNSLVNLMREYQNQNKKDQAAQLAVQIVQRSTGGAEDSGRQQAIAVLAGSGRLPALIERTKTQLERSPNSMRLHQTLIDYYNASGQRDEAKALFLKMSQLRPDDARMQFQLAQRLANEGSHKEAVALYLKALKKEPSLYRNQYWQVNQTFQQASMMDQLGGWALELPLRSLGEYWYIGELIGSLTSQGESTKLRPIGFKLLRKAFDELPAHRGEFLARIYAQDIWQAPEMFDFAREALIPFENASLDNQWSIISSFSMYHGDGRIEGTLRRTIEIAEKQQKLEQLAAEVTAISQKRPDWAAGQAILGVLAARAGRADEARKLLEPLIQKKPDNSSAASVPSQAYWVIGQEIESVAALRDLALIAYEVAVEEQTRQEYGSISFSPARRLALLYRDLNRPADARKLLMRYLASVPNYPYDPGYRAYQTVEHFLTMGRLLTDIGYPVDAIRALSMAMGDRANLDAAQAWNGGNDYLSNQLREQYARAVAAINSETAEQTLLASLERSLDPADRRTDTPASAPAPKPREGQGAPGAVDLVLMVQPRALAQASVVSFLEVVLDAAKSNASKEHTENARAQLLERHPDDLATAVFAAMVSLKRKDARRAESDLAHLRELVARAPLEELLPGKRANARQREAAAGRMPLWLIARALRTNDPGDDRAREWEELALGAAVRQIDPLWAAAMLRERGQRLLDQGDRPGAAAEWRRILEVLLAHSRPRPAGDSKTQGPVLPLQVGQFDQVCDLARMAAEHGINDLSLEAVRQAISGGPPMQVAAADVRFGARQQSFARANRNQFDPILAKVATQLDQLVKLWSDKGVPPADAYAVLVDAVFPAARPGEILLFPAPLGSGLQRPQSVGAALVRLAAAAGKLDDLKARVDARRAQPSALLSANVLALQVAATAGDLEAVRALVATLIETLKGDSLALTADTIAHATLPLLADSRAVAVAWPLAEQLVKSQLEHNSPIAQSLLLHMARVELGRGNRAKAQAAYAELRQGMMAAHRGSNVEYADHLRLRTQELVARDQLLAGELGDALETLGEVADSPRQLFNIPDRNPLALLAPLLAALPPEDRYRTLANWLLPNESRASIRMLGEFLATDRPPAWLVRAARPGLTDAQAAGLPPGRFLTTTGMLLDAARDAGKLDELAQVIDDARAKKVKNADVLAHMIAIAGGKGKEVAPKVRALVMTVYPLKFSSMNADTERNIEWALCLIELCLADPDLRSLGESALANLVNLAAQVEKRAGGLQSIVYELLSLCRAESARSAANRLGAPDLLAGTDVGLQWWGAVSRLTPGKHGQGGAPGRWIEADGIVTRVPGNDSGWLMAQIPLTGSFDFSVDCYDALWTAGVLGYGGGNITGVPTIDRAATRDPGLDDGTGAASAYQFRAERPYQTLTVQVRPKSTHYLVNGHRVFSDDSNPAGFPWLSLGATSHHQPCFCNPRLQGAPEVPREIALIAKEKLDGWITQFGDHASYQGPRKAQPLAAAASIGYLSDSAPPQVNPRWSVEDGVLHASINPLPPLFEPEPDWLTYRRPLFDGEEVTYEFLYEPGKTEVHPALDRLVVLFTAEGLRYHWITDGNDHDPAGLSTGHAVPGPDDLAGPERLPLKPNDWNQVRLARKRDSVALDLNGTPLVTVPLTPSGDGSFSLFHFRDQTAVQVRSIVLRGAWPTSLPTGKDLDLFGRRADAPEPNASRRARQAIVGDAPFLHQAAAIVERVRSCSTEESAEERQARLLDAVLPGEGHEHFLVGGDFVPGSEPGKGGVLVSPALELLAAAKEAGTLDELADRLAKLASSSESAEERARLVLLALTRIAQSRAGEAAELLAQAAKTLGDLRAEAPEHARWPEILAVHAATLEPSLTEAAQPFIESLAKTAQPGLSDRFKAHVGRYAALLKLVADKSEAVPLEAAADTPQWFSASLPAALVHGGGFPAPLWTRQTETLLHQAGTHHDLVYYPVPLHGDFEVAAELVGPRPARLVYGTVTLGLAPDGKSIEVSQLGQAAARFQTEPDQPQNPLAALFGRRAGASTGTGPSASPKAIAKFSVPAPKHGPVPVRWTVKEGKLRLYSGEQLLHEQDLPANPEPWLALYQPGDAHGGVRGLKVSGNPMVPREVNLMPPAVLGGWLDYFEDPTRGLAIHWARSADEIVGKFQPDREGALLERLLAYHRPLVGDGWVEWEFFYQPGKTLAHPALGKTAFVIGPDGVVPTLITDGRFERSTALPGQLLSSGQPASAAPLALKEGDWNRMRLELAGDKLTLLVNGGAAYAGTLATTAPAERHFGIFHFADQTEARVRGVKMGSGWPETVPGTTAASGPTGASEE